MNVAQPVIGKTFGSLTILDTWSEISKGGRAVRHAKCSCSECGHIKDRIRLSHITSGNRKGCGCVRGNKKHGRSRTELHVKWKGINSRCYNSNGKKYKDYGGRGITVCDEWRGANGFINFYNWATGAGFKSGLTIDRIDVNGHYSPDNCRFTGDIQQARNRRNNLLVTYNGQTKCLIEWSEITGISWGVLRYRIVSMGWETGRAFTTPVRVFRRGNKSKLLKQVAEKLVDQVEIVKSIEEPKELLQNLK